MNEDLARWLNQELEDRGWSRSEAARRGGFSPSTLNKVMAGSTNPGLDLLQGIAQAFRMPLEEVLSHAGVLPSYGKLPSEVKLWGKRIVALTPDDRQQVIRAMEAILTVAESPRRYDVQRDSGKPEE